MTALDIKDQMVFILSDCLESDSKQCSPFHHPTLPQVQTKSYNHLTNE